MAEIISPQIVTCFGGDLLIHAVTVAVLLAGTVTAWIPPRLIPNQVARAARRYVDAERDGARLLIEDAHFGLLRALAEESA